MIKFIKNFIGKHKKQHNELIDELDEMYNILTVMQGNEGTVSMIMKNQVELAQDLIRERNEGIKYARK